MMVSLKGFFVFFFGATEHIFGDDLEKNRVSFLYRAVSVASISFFSRIKAEAGLNQLESTSVCLLYFPSAKLTICEEAE